MKKLGLTYEALRAVNSEICCVALTGFGLNGLNADRPAYDYIIQAMTGVMSITGEPDSPPTKTGYSAVDNAAGIMAAFALAAKLVEGKGGQVDVAMYDVMLSQLNYIAAATLNADVTAQRYGRSAHPYLVPAQVFETRKGWLILFISHDRILAAVLQRGRMSAVDRGPALRDHGCAPGQSRHRRESRRGIAHDGGCRDLGASAHSFGHCRG